MHRMVRRMGKNTLKGEGLGTSFSALSTYRKRVAFDFLLPSVYGTLIETTDVASKLGQAAQLVTSTGRARSTGSVSNLHCDTRYCD